MTKEQDALTLALEALEQHGSAYLNAYKAAITALPAAQPEQPQRKPLTDEQEDAARYQHIKGMARAMSLDMNGNHYWHMSLRDIRGPNLDEAIDRAIEAAHNIGANKL